MFPVMTNEAGTEVRVISYQRYVAGNLLWENAIDLVRQRFFVNSYLGLHCYTIIFVLCRHKDKLRERTSYLLCELLTIIKLESVSV